MVYGERLGRNVGLKVAAIDFFENIHPDWRPRLMAERLAALLAGDPALELVKFSARLNPCHLGCLVAQALACASRRSSRSGFSRGADTANGKRA